MDWGVASRRPPPGLPHGAPGAELSEVVASWHRGPPPGRRAVGLRQIDGMPHDPQRAITSVVARHAEKPSRPPAAHRLINFEGPLELLRCASAFQNRFRRRSCGRCGPRERSPRSTTAPTSSNASSWHAPCSTAAATDRAKYVPDVAATDGVQRVATGTPIVTSRRTPRPVISGQGPYLLVWRVKDSNLGRHQPTDLQFAAVRSDCARLSTPPAVPSACPSWSAPAVIHG